MKKIILDGNKMLSKEEVHLYLKDKMELPEYYGMNLDALWDSLTTISEPVDICLVNSENLYKRLGQYAELLIKVFETASMDNKKLLFEII